MATADLLPERPREITLQVEYRDRDMVRAVPGTKHVRDRTWRMPLSWASCLVLRGVFGDRLVIGDGLNDWAWSEHETRVGPAISAREVAMVPPFVADGDERLRTYQRAAVAFLAAAGSCVLADDMGVGKTVEAISLIEQRGLYPALVVAPKGVKRNWADEFATWAPGREVRVIGGTKQKRLRQLEPGADVYVTNYELLAEGRVKGYGSIRLTDADRTPGPLNRDWASVVVDEAHRAINPKNKTTRALWAIGESSGHRFMLTGTPIANQPQDLWSLLHFVSPGEWPSRSEFIDRYVRVSHDWYGGVSFDGLLEENKSEFFAAVDPRLLRRPKELVLPELPPKTYERRWVEMSPKQARAYREMEEKQVAWLDDHPLAAFDQFSVLARLSQFACSYAEIDNDPLSKYTVRLAPPSSKVDAVVELLEDMGDEPLVVFAVSRQLIDLTGARLEKEGIEYGRITGAESELLRDQAKTAFQEGRLRVLLCTLGAGSEGLTLTAASTLCFMQRSFRAIHNQQAEDRVHRMGQTAEKVVIVDLIAPGTVEESVVIPILENKAEILEEVVRDREALRRALCSRS